MGRVRSVSESALSPIRAAKQRAQLMSDERFFVTGALGCLGAWVVRNLIDEGVGITVYDLGSSLHRLELLMEPEEIARIQFVKDDITDTEAVARAVEESGANRIVHLAALQVPFCKANPPLGAAVNVVGTVNVFEAAKRAGIAPVVYASSMAVYGGADLYGPVVQDDDPLHPLNLYGVYKSANEGTARIYWQDDGIASLALRPYTVYGPARDQGMTSTPTQAMLAAAKGEPYHISFGGTCGYQYADDVARASSHSRASPTKARRSLTSAAVSPTCRRSWMLSSRPSRARPAALLTKKRPCPSPRRRMNGHCRACCAMCRTRP